MSSRKPATNQLCPSCRQPAPWDNNPHRPFCTPRCKTLDFGAWANESYAIPVRDEGFSERDVVETH